MVKKYFIVILPLLVLLLLVFTELYLRIKGAPTYALDWQYHSLLGHKGPETKLVKVGRVHHIYNWHGFRGGFHWNKNKKNYDYKILYLGDSFTEASEMPWPYTFVDKSAKLLTASTQKIFTSINLAKSDYGTAQEVLAYYLYGKDLQADAIVLQFLGLNDFINNGIEFSGRNQASSDFVRPYIIPEQQYYQSYLHIKELAFTSNYRWQRYWREHSYLYWYAEAWWARNFLFGRQKSVDCKIELEVFLSESSLAWEKSMNATIQALKFLRTHSDGIPIFPIYFPSEFEADNERFAQTIEPQLKKCYPGRRYSIREPENKFYRVLMASGLPYFTLTPSFRKAIAQRENLYLPSGGHLNWKGHHLAAKFIQNKIQTKLNLRSRQWKNNISHR